MLVAGGVEDTCEFVDRVVQNSPAVLVRAQIGIKLFGGLSKQKSEKPHHNAVGRNDDGPCKNACLHDGNAVCGQARMDRCTCIWTLHPQTRQKRVLEGAPALEPKHLQPEQSVHQARHPLVRHALPIPAVLRHPLSVKVPDRHVLNPEHSPVHPRIAELGKQMRMHGVRRLPSWRPADQIHRQKQTRHRPGDCRTREFLQ